MEKTTKLLYCPVCNHQLRTTSWQSERMTIVNLNYARQTIIPSKTYYEYGSVHKRVRMDGDVPVGFDFTCPGCEYKWYEEFEEDEGRE